MTDQKMESPILSDLAHCPLCGSELRTGTDDHAYECPGCEYTEREVSP